MDEIWLDIKDFEGLYQVSNLGRVKSLDRYVLAGAGVNHKTQHIRGRILKPNMCGKYSIVVLCKLGETYSRLVHRLVADAFIPNLSNLPCVNHKDENPKNNYVNNLEWCTYKYNNEYNDRIGRCRDKISNTLKGRKHDYMLTKEQRQHISDAAKRGWEKRRQRMKEKTEEVEL